jgi:DNA-binding CsgD family transcriptional regulator
MNVMDVIGELAECSTEEEALAKTKSIVEMLGADWFVYTSSLPAEIDSGNAIDGSFRYFIGCSPELCVIYNRRRWMMNDPFFDYARTNTAPIVGSKVKLVTAGQAEIMAVSAQHGFRSGLVVPTHTSMSAHKRMGLLYIGSELPESEGEPMLIKRRHYFGALGAELLLWWIHRLRQQAMRKYSLGEDEVDLLQMSKQGMVASEIAARLDVKVHVVYRRLNNIKEKFDVEKIDDAVAEADAVGLLG